MDFSNTAPLGIALLGLAMGMRHATDPDHVVAVTTIVTGERRITAASTIGLVWGLGHTMTVIAVGVAIILFKVAIPVRLGLTMEFAVAIVLILLGVRAAIEVSAPVAARLRALVRGGEADLLVHSHPHRHGTRVHTHPHVHAGIEPDPAREHDHTAAAAPFALRRPFLRAFAVGLVHGLAGSAAIALLVLSAIPEPRWAVAYLILFGIGTMLGMILITTAIGLPYAFAAKRAARTHRALAVGSGLLSFGFGLLLAYQIGIVDGLFRATAHWTPH